MKICELGDKWQDAYKHCILNYQAKLGMAIAKYYRPKKLYKHFSFDNSYWKQNAKGDVAFCYPSSFNDPMDARWFLNYESIIDARFGEKGSAVKLVGDDVFSIMKRGYETDFMYLQDNFSVACFSTTPYSNPMWGHYSSKHSGFCIEYDVDLMNLKNKVLIPVAYGDKPFDASRLIDMDGVDDKFSAMCPLVFKSKDWSYENEWRIFLKNTSDNDVVVENMQSSITGIYFGLKSIGLYKRKVVESWAKKQKIPCHQIERSYCSFELLSDTIEDIKQGKMRGFIL